MPAFGFKAEFIDGVASGRKRQTIRAARKDRRPPCKVGDHLTFYTGLRTKQCRKIGEGVCTFVQPIAIGEDAFDIAVDGRPLSIPQQRRLARADDFPSLTGDDGMICWFRRTHGLPFTGWLIKWSPADA